MPNARHSLRARRDVGLPNVHVEEPGEEERTLVHRGRAAGGHPGDERIGGDRVAGVAGRVWAKGAEPAAECGAVVPEGAVVGEHCHHRRWLVDPDGAGEGRGHVRRAGMKAAHQILERADHFLGAETARQHRPQPRIRQAKNVFGVGAVG